MPDIDALNHEDLDTPAGQLRVAIQPGGWLAVERLDPYDPEMRKPICIHVLDERGPFSAVYGKRVLERQALKQMYAKAKELNDNYLAAAGALVSKDFNKELQKLVKRDQDAAALMLGKR